MVNTEFPYPVKTTDTIHLLNAKDWNLSLFEHDESLILIYDGDQLQIGVTSKEEVQAFLAGAFLATFYGAELEDIKDELKSPSKDQATN